MNIIVCIKQVPDTQNIKIDSQTNTLIREGVQSIINPFDMHAIEEGLRLKEKNGGQVTVISMGPLQVEEALREALSMGVDEAYLVSDRALAGSDTLVTSLVLARVIQHTGNYDIIICGKQSIDGDTAQVGPGIAAHLGLPQVMFVKKITITSRAQEHKGTRAQGHQSTSMLARVERMTEEGYEILDTPLPLVISVVKEINKPRLPSLKGKLRAKSATIKKWTLKDLNLKEDEVGLKGSPTQVIKMFTPPLRKGGQILTGALSETVPKIAEEIKKIITGV